MRAPLKRERPAPASRSVVRRDMAGKELGRVDLPGEVFGITPNESVVHQVVTAQLAAARSGTQSTRTRAEVRGGGAKPFRQKGTGRARQGSTRSPLWPGGGVALGPKPRSYRQRTPKKMVRLALCSALSDRAADERVALVDAWRFAAPRTKDAVAALDALGLDGKVLVVLGADELEAERSFGNLQRVQTVAAGELSAYDVLRNDWVVFSDGTLPGSTASEGTLPGSTASDGTLTDGAGDESPAAPLDAEAPAPRKAAATKAAAKKAPAAKAPATKAPAKKAAVTKAAATAHDTAAEPAAAEAAAEEPAPSEAIEEAAPAEAAEAAAEDAGAGDGDAAEAGEATEEAAE